MNDRKSKGIFEHPGQGSIDLIDDRLTQAGCRSSYHWAAPAMSVSRRRGERQLGYQDARNGMRPKPVHSGISPARFCAFKVAHTSRAPWTR